MKRLGLAAVVILALNAPAAAATLIFVDCDPAGPCSTFGPSLSFEVHDGVVDVRSIFSNDHSGNHALGFNILGSEAGLTISNLTTGFVVGGNNESIGPFGNFEYLISVPGEPGEDPCCSQRWHFTISRDIGFLSDMEVFERNALGFFAAETILGCCGLSGVYASDLGFGSGGQLQPIPGPPQPEPVPEPASVILLGTGLAAAWRVRRQT